MRTKLDFRFDSWLTPFAIKDRDTPSPGPGCLALQGAFSLGSAHVLDPSPVRYLYCVSTLPGIDNQHVG
jgi:hypothetical protein